MGPNGNPWDVPWDPWEPRGTSRGTPRVRSRGIRREFQWVVPWELPRDIPREVRGLALRTGAHGVSHRVSHGFPRCHGISHRNPRAPVDDLLTPHVLHPVMSSVASVGYNRRQRCTSRKKGGRTRRSNLNAHHAHRLIECQRRKCPAASGVLVRRTGGEGQGRW